MIQTLQSLDGAPVDPLPELHKITEMVVQAFMFGVRDVSIDSQELRNHRKNVVDL